MRRRKLAVEGAHEFIPEVFTDVRGRTVAPFQQSELAEATGRAPFRLAQSLQSTSRRDVLRDVHYTAFPPGGAKYVHCARGAALDFIVDLRVGSPTFGRHAVVQLDQHAFRAVHCPIGVGHGFVALEDDTVMSYLLSTEYVPAQELAISALDPQLRLPLPSGLHPIRSARDAAAPSLAEAAEMRLLPDYRRCKEAE